MLAAYRGAFRVPFILDDEFAIVHNESLRRLSALSDVFSPPAEVITAGRPLSNFSFAVSYAISGLQPWGYHLLNIAIHSLAAVLLFGVLRRTLLSPVLRASYGQEASLLALGAALIWAVHPLATETVTYVSQRTESLMALFYLLTLYCFIRGVEGQPGLWFPLAVTACLLGALSKEVIATAPLIVLLYDRTFAAGSFRSALRSRWLLYACLAATWAPLAWLLAGVRSHAVGYGLGASWSDYALTECKAVALYLRLCLWPHPLVFDRGTALVASVGEALPYAVVLAGLVAGAIWASVRRPALGFACAWFLVILAPTSSVVPIVGAPIAENRPYLPLAAVIALAVLLLYKLAGPLAVRVVCGLLVVGCITATAHRNLDYASSYAIWTDTIAKEPDNFRAYGNRALLLASMPGRQSDALADYGAALRLNPFSAEVHCDLATLLLFMPGRRNDAVAHFEAALRINPNFAEAHNNLGYLLAKEPEGRLEALAHYEAALRLRPEYPEAHNNLGALLTDMPGRRAEALAHIETSLRLNPDNAEAHCNLARLLSEDPGRRADAIAQYRIALRIDPGSNAAQNGLRLIGASSP